MRTSVLSFGVIMCSNEPCPSGGHDIAAEPECHTASSPGAKDPDNNMIHSINPQGQRHHHTPLLGTSTQAPRELGFFGTPSGNTATTSNCVNGLTVTM